MTAPLEVPHQAWPGEEFVPGPLAALGVQVGTQAISQGQQYVSFLRIIFLRISLVDLEFLLLLSDLIFKLTIRMC